MTGRKRDFLVLLSLHGLLSSRERMVCAQNKQINQFLQVFHLSLSVSLPISPTYTHTYTLFLSLYELNKVNLVFAITVYIEML